ncbi:MAG TPA: phosphonate ABC transporter ATP-binding protein [Actinomycetales bacterium]|nr:phosphonate ABC transporter ATP-binding protein [Actinomycetales bacterium]
MTQAPVVFENVTKQFSPTVRGLDEVSVEVRPNQVTTLLGLSGSGKSTLLRHVNGLQKPTSGEITTLGVRVDRASERELRRLRHRIGFIFQHFHLVGSMSVLENVCTGRLGRLHGPRISLMSYPRAVRREALEQLDRVGLADRAYQRADTLSGGQQQRVAIARALIQKPEILLADEPVASLDPVSSSLVMELIRDIAHEQDLTVLISLHQVEVALKYSDHLIGLQNGQVVLNRPVSAIGREEAYDVYQKVAVPDSVEEIARGPRVRTPRDRAMADVVIR